MEFEPIDDFEKELRQALVRRPAPPSLKRKLMERRGHERAKRKHFQFVIWRALAASVVVAAVLSGAMEWQLHRAEDRHRGEEARRQVIMALRITGHALNEVNLRLTAHQHDDDQ